MKRGEGEFNWLQKEMKMIASQGSKIAIQSIGSITGHLSDGKHASSSFKKKNPSRQGVLLISYIFYVLTRLQHLENRAHCAEANLARAVEDIHQLRYFAWSSQQRNWRDYARSTFLVANGKAAKAFSKLLELSFER